MIIANTIETEEEKANRLAASLKAYKKDAVKAAKDLEYPKEVIDAINKSDKEYTIIEIMHKARMEKFK